MSAPEEKESFLTDDPEISAQKWCLLSFISPENVLNRKDMFFFNAFLKQYEFQLRTKSLEQFLVKSIQTINAKLDAEATRLDGLDLSGAALECRKSTLSIEPFITDFQETVKKNQREMLASTLNENYDDFMYKNGAKLEDDFYAKNNFRTTVRGLKIRGAYSTKEEADMRAKKLQKADPDHNIYVGQVGKWLPWDPKPSDVGEQEYAEEQLNTLMKKYKDNEEAREMFMRENRNKMRNGPQTTVTRDAAEPAATVPAAFNAMFDGPADLAMQRKMENKQ
jgi:hypothetical protein